MSIRERREHIQSHRGPNNFICHLCNMRFIHRGSLRRHMYVHTGTKLFTCEVCQRSFSQATSHMRHMLIHTREKPYQCQHCDKSFNHNVSLKSHILRYHGHVPDPGDKVQMERSSMKVSEVEKDESNQMDSSAVDADGSGPSNTLCNPENGGDEKERVGKRTQVYKPTGRPRGRPKKNAVSNFDDWNPGNSSDEQESVFEPWKKKRKVNSQT